MTEQSPASTAHTEQQTLQPAAKTNETVVRAFSFCKSSSKSVTVLYYISLIRSCSRWTWRPTSKRRLRERREKVRVRHNAREME